VVREGCYVLRPVSPHSESIHALLRHVRAAGFDGVPEPLGIDPDGRERLVFIPGVRRRVERGEPAFVEMWERMGRQARYDRRRDWFARHRDHFVEALG
jgi:hypothetical protein